MPHRLGSQFLRPISRLLGWSSRQVNAFKGQRVDVLTLHPQGPVRGRVAFSYLTEPWIYPQSLTKHYHTNRWECHLFAETFREAGYRVDVVDYSNSHYRPPADCAFAFDLDQNLERWAETLPAGCVKIQHASTPHWLFNNQAELIRLSGIRDRRGASLKPRRQITPNCSSEAADHIIYVGNEFTEASYAFAQKPMHRIPISTVVTADWPAKKNWEKARRNFIWFGSVGLALKGLDLALEAFARMPELNLLVVGGVELESDFSALYHRELFQSPNIRYGGFVDVTAPAFLELIADCAGVVFPAASEGGAGSVICCMHGGLIPIVTREASVDVAGFGVQHRSACIDEIIADVQRVAQMPPAELAERSRAAWEHVRRTHSRENFRAVWRQFARNKLGLKLEQP